VGDSTHQNPAASTAPDLGRRQFLCRAAVAGTVVWTVPTIVSIETAFAADRHSAPPKPPVEPVGAVSAPPAAPAPLAVTKRAGPTQLPFTGDNEVVEFGVGLAAVVGGAALIALGAEAEQVWLDAE
jgi:hypothetical protein